MSDILVINLDKIKGNCTIADALLKDNVELLSFSHGVSMPMGSSASNSERTVGRASVGEFSFSKKSDIATTELYQYCVLGTPIPKVILHVGRVEGEKGKYMPNMTYTFYNVLISSVSTSGGGGIPSDSFSINFTKVECTYTKQKTDSSQQGTAAWAYDMATVEGQ